MNKAFKKLLSITLCLMMVLGSVAVSGNIALASEPEEGYKKGDIIKLGTYEQDNNTDNGKEAIEWILLNPSTGLCVSRYALDARRFDDDSDDSYDYESSEIKVWLTGDFYNDTFSNNEKAAISEDPELGKVFLLSTDEASNTSYFANDKARICEPTQYAIANGAYVDGTTGGCWWWLRSPGSSSDQAAGVYDDGGVDYIGDYVDDDYGCVRPALYLNLESKITLNANNGSEKTTKQTVQNFKSFYPKCPAEFTNGTKIFCGWYLDAACQQPWNETDTVEKDMTLYAGWTTYKKGDIIKLGTYEQDNNTENGKEAIEWIVLDPSTGLCVSRYALDAKWFDDNSNDYQSSEIKEWLTGDFYKNNFNDNEKTSIVEKDRELGKVFLLSTDEASNTSYFANDKARICNPTQYAIANGAYVYGTTGACWWWLRSPGSNFHCGADVCPDGHIDYGGNNVGHNDDGVRPALYLNLESDIFKSEITLNANNGSGETAKQTVQNFKSFYPECPAEFTNGTKIFCGWYLDAACQQPWNETDTIEKDMTLYAGWTTYKTGDIIKLGTYEQDNNTENGKEAIEWIVLDPSTGLCVSRYALDAKRFDDNSSDYQSSEIKKWLTGEFYNNTFSNKEEAAIFEKDRELGKVFLLSVEEASNTSYFADNTARICKPTQYAIANKAVVYGGCVWWLRSYAARVDYDGDVYDLGDGVDLADVCVRPALYLNLESEIFKSVITLNANNGSGETAKQTVQNFKSFYPKCPAEFTNGTKIFCGWYLDAACQQPWNETDTVEGNMTLYAGWTTFKTGDIIEFGWYPQTKVTDSAIISALKDYEGDNKTWESYNYYIGTGTYDDGKMKPSNDMRYTDVVYGNAKYRGVVFDSYRPYCTGYTSLKDNTYQDDNNYETGTIYWFKYEPIKWRVLDPATGLVLSETILDSQAYNNYLFRYDYEFWGDSAKTYYANNYANSSIRQWLNKDFCNTAFLPSQQNIIQSTILDNDSSIKDKIFLLSYSDTLNNSYGFDTESDIKDTAKTAQGSDYAKCQGLYVDSSNGNSYWRLRSDGGHSFESYCVGYDGDVDDDYGTDYSYGGVRAALYLNLKSDLIRTEIATCKISPVADITYTGNEICPEITITDGENILVKDWDYTVAYSNNTNAGTATVTVTGIEKYKGQTTTVFNITKADQKAPTGITKTDETKCSADDGTISGLTTAMEIAYERGAYAPCKGSELTGLASGTYSVRYAEDSNHNASPSIQIVIQKGACYGGTATCVNKAICDGCKEEYGALGDHDWDDFHTVDTEATYETAGSESIHCKRCTATKDSRSIMSKKEKFEIEKSKEIASLNEFAKEHTSRYSQRIINRAVDEINSYVYDRNISFEGNVQNINAIKDAAVKKVMDRHNFIYGCPFLSFFANILEPVFVCLNRLSSQSGNSVLTEITESIIRFLGNFAC